MKNFGIILLITGGLLLTACGMSVYQIDTSEKAEDETAAHRAESSTAESSSEEASAASEYDFPDLHSFQAKTIEGDSFSPENFAGADVTAINIWSTTCGPCIREMPELAEYAKTLPENLRIMTWCIDADISASGSEIAKYLSECGFQGITLASGDGDLQKLYQKLMYTPTTIFVDSEGNLVAEPLVGAGDISARYSVQFDAALKQLGKS